MPDRTPLPDLPWDPNEVERLLDLLAPLAGDERERRIDEECAGHPALEEEVRSLLELAPAASWFFWILRGRMSRSTTGAEATGRVSRWRLPDLPVTW